MEQSPYGNITVGHGTSFQKEIGITEYIQAHYKDNRLISISGLEDGSILAAVENPMSTGRNTQSTIWLSKESFIGMLGTAMLYFSAKGEDMAELMKDAAGNIISTENIKS